MQCDNTYLGAGTNRWGAAAALAHGVVHSVEGCALDDTTTTQSTSLVIVVHGQ